MAEKITLWDSSVITVFSMAVVFIVLLAIAYLIRFLKAISSTGEKPQVENEKQPIPIKGDSEILGDEEVVDEELAAVIAAAIAASLGLSHPELNIKAIRRVYQPVPTWIQVGRAEQIMKRL